MTLAAILGICLLSSSWSSSGTHSSAFAQAGQATPSTPTQTTSGPPAHQQNQATPSKPAPANPRRHRKTTSNCPDSATAGKPAGGQTPSASATAGSTSPNPCPPKKTVVRNGGTDEASVQLTGSDPAKQVSQGTTEQLLAATDENLKKLSGRELKADQQQTLNQIREFVEQSKQAMAAGDLEQGQNLASKARLLSDELVKP